MNKPKVLILAGAQLSTVLISFEATAALKIGNGASYTTKQKNDAETQVTKNIMDMYKCAINPTAKSSAAKKLVWINQDCINMNNLYVEGIANFIKLKADTKNISTKVSTLERSVEPTKISFASVCCKLFQ